MFEAGLPQGQQSGQTGQLQAVADETEKTRVEGLLGVMRGDGAREADRLAERVARFLEDHPKVAALRRRMDDADRRSIFRRLQAMGIGASK